MAKEPGLAPGSTFLPVERLLTLVGGGSQRQREIVLVAGARIRSYRQGLPVKLPLPRAA